MHTTRTLMLGLLFLGGSSLAADHSKEFCAAFTEAAAGMKTYDEVLLATMANLGADGMSGRWGQVLRAVWHSAPGNHVAILKSGAAELGETFSCPAFEFPAGAPKFTALLQGEQARGIDAIGADGNGLTVLRTARVKGSDRGLLWEVKEKAPVRVLAEGLPQPSYNAQLVFTSTAVIVALEKEIVSVPRAGGDAKPLAAGLGMPWALVVDGDGLVFIAGGALHRVPLAGGEVKRLAVLHEESQQFAIAVSPGGFLVGGFGDGKVVRVTRAGVMTTVMARGANSVFALGAELLMHFGSDEKPRTPSGIRKFSELNGVAPQQAAPSPPEGTYRLPFAAEAPVRLGPWIEGAFPVVSQGEVYALDMADPRWPGRRQLLRWKPGAASPTPVAAPVGDTRQLAVDGKRVYWLDPWFGQLFAAPR